MRIKQKIRIYVDFAMILLMPCLMAYSLISGKIHEWLGMAMFFLFFAHHLLNLGWYRAMIKGHYTATRIVRTSVNMLLLIVMVLLAVSSVIMSGYAPWDIFPPWNLLESDACCKENAKTDKSSFQIHIGTCCFGLCRLWGLCLSKKAVCFLYVFTGSICIFRLWGIGSAVFCRIFCGDVPVCSNRALCISLYESSEQK